MIREERLVQQFSALVEIDAPSLEERDLADVVKHELTALGLEVREDEAGRAIGGNCGNVYASWPGTIAMEPLLFCAHFDTVEPGRGKKAVIREDGLITSTGDTVLGADDLAGVTGILEAIRSIHEDGRQHRPVEVMITVAEEKHLLGATQLEPAYLKARQAYVLDASGPPGTAVTRAPGNIESVFEIRGKSAHAGMEPEKGISAVTVAAKGIAAMKLGRIDAETTANIGRISGGGATNVVADSCMIHAECRSQDPVKLAEQAAHMRACLEQAAAEMGAAIKVSQRTAYLPYQVSQASAALARFNAACRALDIRPEQRPAGGGSDNNTLVLHGIDGIVLTCGMDKVHSCEEQIHIKDLVNTAKLVEQLILLP